MQAQATHLIRGLEMSVTEAALSPEVPEEWY
jgi:hypothetical protein